MATTHPAEPPPTTTKSNVSLPVSDDDDDGAVAELVAEDEVPRQGLPESCSETDRREGTATRRRTDPARSPPHILRRALTASQRFTKAAVLMPEKSDRRDPAIAINSYTS